MPPVPTTPAGNPATRQPIPAEVVRALEDLAGVLDALSSYFHDPIDAVCIDLAAHHLRELSDVHRPHATPDQPDPEDDLL